jgi:large subunit ribosomal protein L10
MGIHMHVVKNSLARRALSDGPLEQLAKSMEGPCTLVYGEPALTDIAKTLAKWAKDNKEIKLKYGIMDGDPEVTGLADLARMKGRTELIGEIGMLIASPGRALAGAIGGPAGRIAGCLKAMAEKADAAAEQADAA